MANKSDIDYRKLNQELETILRQLETNDLDVDEAVVQYQRGVEIVALLEDYLKTAENKVVKIKQV